MANTSKEMVNMLFDVIRLYTDKSVEEGIDYATEQINNYAQSLTNGETSKE